MPWEELFRELSLDDRRVCGFVGPPIWQPGQPDVRGEVVFVDSEIVVLRVTEGASDSTTRDSFFALFREGRYLAEARVVRRRDNLLACRVVQRIENATIMIGDRAATNL